jgi:hypothetical protein
MGKTLFEHNGFQELAHKWSRALAHKWSRKKLHLRDSNEAASLGKAMATD